MNGTQFEKVMMDWTWMGRGPAEARSRALRKAGMWPEGGRGPHAAQLSAHHRVFGLIAFLVARSEREVEECCILYSKMVDASLEISDTMLRTLANIISNPARVEKVEMVDFNLTRAHVRLEFTNSLTPILFYPEGHRIGSEADGTYSIPCAHFRIPGTALTQIACAPGSGTAQEQPLTQQRRTLVSAKLSTKVKKVGRPKTGATPLLLRLLPDDLESLDNWIKSQPRPRPNRQNAIRSILREKFGLV